MLVKEVKCQHINTRIAGSLSCSVSASVIVLQKILTLSRKAKGWKTRQHRTGGLYTYTEWCSSGESATWNESPTDTWVLGSVNVKRNGHWCFVRTCGEVNLLACEVSPCRRIANVLQQYLFPPCWIYCRTGRCGSSRTWVKCFEVSVFHFSVKTTVCFVTESVSVFFRCLWTDTKLILQNITVGHDFGFCSRARESELLSR